MPTRTKIAAVLFAGAMVVASLLSGVMPVRAVTIETVPIGNAGNAPSSRSGSGAVEYDYRLGKYEVTNAEYVGFLNSVDPTGGNKLALYNTSMSSDARGGINRNAAAAAGAKYEIKTGRERDPVVYVSCYDAVRFINWLHNGQGSGSTESGAYTMLRATPPDPRIAIVRNAGSKWWLPSLAELRKAAYHMNDGVTANYWDYPFSSNSIPSSDQPPGSGAPLPANTANFYSDDGLANGYNDGFAVTGSTSNMSAQNYLTNVGAYASSTSPYGTFDQGGNVSEWSDAVSDSAYQFGGSWQLSAASMRNASGARNRGANAEASDVGFRVAAMPEPSGAPINIAVDFDSTVQFSSGDRRGPIRTKAGYRSWNVDWSFDSVAFGTTSRFLEEGVEYQLQAFAPNAGPAGRPYSGSRLRPPGIGGTSDELLDDFVFVENTEGNFLCLTIGGLPVGSYRMTSWHYDSYYGSGAQPNYMQIEVGDQQAGAIAAATSVVADHFPLSKTPQVFEFQVTAANGVKEIVFRNDDSPANPGAGGYRTRLNGFTLVRVPEPSSALLAVLALALVWLAARGG